MKRYPYPSPEPRPRLHPPSQRGCGARGRGCRRGRRVGASFPASSPTFKLVSLTKTGAKIGIAGGSLASGSQTVMPKRNKTLTLMNTADGKRYVLRLLSVK